MGVEVSDAASVDVDTEQLIPGYLSGDGQIGDLLAGKVREALNRIVRRYHLKPQDYEEIVQETMLQVFARIPEFDQSRGSFESWLVGFLANTVRTHRRREVRVRIADIPVDEVQSLSYEMGALAGEREALKSAIDTLEVLDRELLHMRYSLGMSSEEIAANSDMNAPQVRKRISRAMERLRCHPSIQGLIL